MNQLDLVKKNVFYVLLLALAFLTLLPKVAWGAETDLVLEGYLKLSWGVAISEADPQISDTLSNRLKYRLFLGEEWTFACEMGNILSYGDTTLDYPSYNEISLRDTWLNSKNYSIYSEIDRVYLDWKGERLELTIGRQRINWALTGIWSPNDIFGTYAFSDAGYLEKPGLDAVRLRSFINPLSQIEVIWAPASCWENTGLAAIYRWNIRGCDLQVIGGKAGYAATFGGKDHPDLLFAGLGFSGNIGKLGISGEGTYFDPGREQFEDSAALSLNLKYLCPQPEILFRLEGYYTSNPAKPENLADPLPASSLSFSNLTINGGVTVFPLPLLTIGADVTWYCDPLSLNSNLTANWSLSDNVGLLGSVQYLNNQDSEMNVSDEYRYTLQLSWYF